MNRAATRLQEYAYRAPRLACQLRAEFVYASGCISSWVENLSEQGLLMDFGEPLAPETRGRLRLHAERCLVELEVSVTHSQGFSAGLTFLFASEAERFFVRALLQALDAERLPIFREPS